MTKGNIIKESIPKNLNHFSTFYKISEALRSSFDFDKLLNEIIMLAANEIEAETGSIMLLEDDKLVVRASYGNTGRNLIGESRKIGKGISGWVAKKGKGLLVKNILKEPDFKHHFNPRYKSPDFISAPIMVKDSLFGVVNINYKKSKKPFNKSDLKMLLILAHSIGMVIDNFKLIEDVRIKERTATIGELTAKFAHEIRNPLNGIKMNVQILHKKNKSPDLDEHYNIILGEIKRLDNLLKMILDQTRVGKFTMAPLYINNILKESLSIVTMSEPGIRIKAEYGDIQKIIGDRYKLEQAFLNVILNGVQAMEGKGTIGINTSRIKDWIKIDISDTGKGIQKKDKDKIFSPFYTTRADGTGFGLSITEKIIKQHNGRISFTSQKGKGTVFHILLPDGKKQKKAGGKE